MKSRLITALCLILFVGCADDPVAPSANTVTDIDGNVYHTVTDIDGNVYHTVTVGSQVWMVENLRTTRYNDGTPIPEVTDQQSWKSRSTPAYCWYDNDAVTYKNTYGALYNWHTVRTGKLAPKGWHVPSDAEWHTLMATLDKNAKANEVFESETAGGSLKEKDTTHWRKPNTGATDSCGFKALPGGNRNEYGGFWFVREQADWWTSSDEGDATNAWIRFLAYDSRRAHKYYTQKVRGLSVRCVKD